MRQNLTFILSLLFTFNSISQECNSIKASHTLEQGKLRYIIQKGDSNFNEFYLKQFNIDIDKHSYVPIIKSTNLWIGGTTRSQSLKTTYGFYDQQDWRAGFNPENDMPNSENCAFWDTIFVVTKADIKKAIKIIDQGRPCDELPLSIINWPAKGNSNIPKKYSNDIMATFIDINADGEYSPCQGDLPFPPTEVLWSSINNFPTEMTFNVYRSTFYDPVTNVDKSNQQVMEYNLTYNCPMAKNAILKVQQIQNFSNEDIIDMFMSQWTDFEIGCGDNDYIGTSPNHDLVYAYNSTNENCDKKTFGNKTPIVGSMLLRGPYLPYIKSNINGIDTIIAPIPGTGVADTFIQSNSHSIIPIANCLATDINDCITSDNLEVYNQIRGLKKDGSSFLDPNNKETFYPLNGNPSNNGSFSMCSYPSQSNYSLLNVGPALNQPGRRLTITTAIFLSEDQPNSCINSDAITYKAEEIKEFKNNSYFCPTTPTQPTLKANLYKDKTIQLELSDIPFNYKAGDRYHPLSEDHHYYFEGVKIYQIVSPDLDLSLLDNPKFSKMVYQGDIINDVESIYDWKPLFETNTVNFDQLLKASGQNIGIENRITLDHDILHDQAFDYDSTYHFVTVSYGKFKAENFDTITGIGQKYIYIESNEDLKIIPSIKSGTSIISETNKESIPFSIINNINDVRLVNVSSNLDIHIYNVNGIEYGYHNVSSSSATLISEADSLSPGLYFIRIKDKQSNKFWTYKIIKLN